MNRSRLKNRLAAHDGVADLPKTPAYHPYARLLTGLRLAGTRHKMASLHPLTRIIHAFDSRESKEGGGKLYFCTATAS